MIAESFKCTVIVRATPELEPDYLSLKQVMDLLESGNYELEVALPHEGGSDNLSLIFTEKK